jgi:hypothetical protein
MEYIVTSDRKVCGKRPGETIVESDIISGGRNVKLLLSLGQIQPKEAPKTKVTQAPQEKEQPQVQKEEPEAFVFKSDYEGDK